MATQDKKKQNQPPELSGQDKAERERRIAEILLKIKRRLQGPAK